jgi:hypothetical protein
LIRAGQQDDAGALDQGRRGHPPGIDLGAIVLDISTLAKAAAPELLGFVVPKGETRVPYATVAGNPYVYDAIPRGEYLYFTDLTGGFHVARMSPEVVRGNDWLT